MAGPKLTSQEPDNSNRHSRVTLGGGNRPEATEQIKRAASAFVLSASRASGSSLAHIRLRAAGRAGPRRSRVGIANPLGLFNLTRLCQPSDASNHILLAVVRKRPANSS